MKSKKSLKAQSNASQRPPAQPRQSRNSLKHHNKENLIQITEPLDVNSQTYPSKEFILSRESTNHHSKSYKQANMNNHSRSLKELSQNVQKERYSNQVQYPPKKSQELFDRRLSLKCTGNYSQQLDYQKSQRLSMAPLRRQSLGQTIGAQSWLDQRESTSSIYQNSMFSGQTKPKQTIKKQTIITNLMHKLDHEEDLRSIIQSKLRNGNNNSNISCQLTRQKKNQSYITDYTQGSQQSHYMMSKIQQYQNEILQFKNTIRDMSEKIIELTHQNQFKKRNQNNQIQSQRNEEQVTNFLRQIGTCTKCQPKHSKTVSTQVDSSHYAHLGSSKVNESFDFMDNLERTLKVLDGNH